jgi:DNA modification methylase
MEDAAFRAFLRDAFTCMYGAAKPGAPAYVFHADTEGVNFREAFTEAGFYLAQALVWVKSSLVMGRSDYHWRHEPILYGWRADGSH